MDRLIQPRRVPVEVQEQIKSAVRNLPKLGKHDVEEDEICAICLTPFSAILAEADAANGVEAPPSQPVPGSYIEDEEGECLEGITKVDVCGHRFCRRDLSEWIKGFHGSCPTCRQPFLDIRFPSETDDESSDGGEYVPTEDFEDEDDTFEFTDGFSEVDTPDVDIVLEDYLQHQTTGADDDAVSISNLTEQGTELGSDAWVPGQDEVSETSPEEDDDFPGYEGDLGSQASEPDFTEVDLYPPTLYTMPLDSDDELDGDYVPMDEDSDSDISEPSFYFTDRESEGMSSEPDDLSIEEIYSGVRFEETDGHVSVHDMEDDMDLPDHEKRLSPADSSAGMPSSSRK
ncbi:hypothetical protein CC1G_00266 [Coprinopsis cinerea okayama7|uniref:Uncharacterized protein n=1 Tax=Coprinopsis cinerea (strain Okayama-7 / 130 / ATCC MYA-4618 / FGSC 9003) TaxID=240176 RepID=A8NXC7_COPC7|nr:hypothetical protein CC1G_00266 [Coprinopsis cinerea okayama7\|eukprot:XP_001837130.1 hypothetical protein CC1G_00266 [Coprinopsis cinerea okayama7\